MAVLCLPTLQFHRPKLCTDTSYFGDLDERRIRMAKWSALSSPISSFRNIFDMASPQNRDVMCRSLIIGGMLLKSIGRRKINRAIRRFPGYAGRTGQFGVTGGRAIRK